jgi:predicted extracellular nuclease
VRGVVVGNFATGLQGVFVQSERDDGDPATAEGIFVERTAEVETEAAHRRPRAGSGRVSKAATSAPA